MDNNGQFATFYVAGLYLGIEVFRVQEVNRYQAMTRVPLAPAVVSGLINLRGQIVTALDLRRRLELPDRPDDQYPTNVVVRVGEDAVSLLVDDVGDVIEVANDLLESAPATVTGVARELIRGVYKLDGALLLLLDLDKTVTVDEAPAPAEEAA